MAAGPRSVPAGQQRGGHRRPGPGFARLAGRHSVAGTSDAAQSAGAGRSPTPPGGADHLIPSSSTSRPVNTSQVRRSSRSCSVIALGLRCALDPPICAASRRQPSSFAVLRNWVFCTPALVSWQAELALRSLRAFSALSGGLAVRPSRHGAHAASPCLPAAPADCARTGASTGAGTRTRTKSVAQGGGDAAAQPAAGR